NFFRTGSFSWADAFPQITAFVVERHAGGLGGFLEASIRPFADGCSTRPVGYIEGWFVDADMRQQGVGKRLVAVAEQWAIEHGCQEMASDAHIANQVSLDAHLALGYEQTNRLAHFRKWLQHSDAEHSSSIRPRSLVVLQEILAVCRLGQNAALPAWVAASSFF